MKGIAVLLAVYTVVVHVADAGNILRRSRRSNRQIVETCPLEQETDWSVEYLMGHEYCNMYYQCVHGKPVARPCPPSLHFDLTIMACNWPNLVDCGDRIIPDASTTASPTTTTSTTTTTPTTSAPVTTTTTQAPTTQAPTTAPTNTTPIPPVNTTTETPTTVTINTTTESPTTVPTSTTQAPTTVPNSTTLTTPILPTTTPTPTTTTTSAPTTTPPPCFERCLPSGSSEIETEVVVKVDLKQ